MVCPVHLSVRRIAALVLQLSPQPAHRSAVFLLAPSLEHRGFLLQCVHAVFSIELISQFRLAAVLKAVHRFMQQRAFERSIAVVVVAAKANAVARRGIKPIKASWAVIQHKHARVPGNLDLCNQREQAQAGRCTQGFWLSFGSVPLINRLMLLR